MVGRDIRCPNTSCGERITVRAESESEHKDEDETSEIEQDKVKKCSRCGAPIGYLTSFAFGLCKQCRDADHQNKAQAKQAEAQRQQNLAVEAAQRQAEARRISEIQQRRAMTVGVRRWRYKMVQIPPNIAIQQGTSTTAVASAYLERVVEEHAELGWEFYRVDEVGVIVNPGCLTALLGGKGEFNRYFVVTFRCPLSTASETESHSGLPDLHNQGDSSSPV
jgi:hypothetical protein